MRLPLLLICATQGKLQRGIRCLLLALSIFCLPLETATAAPALATTLAWRTLASGLEAGVATFLQSPHAPQGTALVVLRIQPEFFQFSLHMASRNGQALAPAEWAVAHELIAGINASMYREDNKTSTGYMRAGEHTNNPRVGANLGAFFVAEPNKPGLPLADMLEAGDENLEALLDSYAIAVQNYRLITRKGNIVWNEGGNRTSIAVVGNDNEGRILFILCEEPMTPAELAALLQALPLALRTVMYVEGGSPAALFLEAQAVLKATETPEAVLAKTLDQFLLGQETGQPYYIIRGRQSFLLGRGSPAAPLPNILGIAPRP